MTEPSGTDVDLLWEEFHRVVNMSSDELRTWLLTRASGERSFGADPDLGVDELGRKVLHVMAKRKSDLTRADLETMSQVIDFVEDLRAMTPPESARDDWRHELMSVGHDPLRPSKLDSME